MELIQNNPVVIPFIAIILAEMTKAFIDIITRREAVRFAKTGGMPSGHSAFVAALVVVVANREGVNSTAFIIAAVFAVIVMYDAINLRGEAGRHAAAINKLDKKADLEESLGHNHLEVVVGATFGAIIAFLLLTI